MTNQARPLKIIAVVVLKLPDGRVVLQRRTKEAPVAAGKLGFFGGHLEEGETPEQCARRELAEETSLDVAVLEMRLVKEFVLPSSVNYSQDRHFYIYEVLIPSDTFDVYEGIRAESYDVPTLLNRDDISEVVRRVLGQDAG